MKTTAIFSLIVTMLMLTNNSSAATNLFPGYIHTGVDVVTMGSAEPLASFFESGFEDMLDVHAWMLDESAFTPVEETEMIPVEDWMMGTEYTHEVFTDVEDWMFSMEAFEAAETNFEETLEPTEEWMLNLEAFTSHSIVEVETMVEVEPWMLDVATFETIEINAEPVEEWMLNPEPFINSAVVEPMLEVEDWMLSVESFENGAEELMNECPFEDWMMKF